MKIQLPTETNLTRKSIDTKWRGDGRDTDLAKRMNFWELHCKRQFVKLTSSLKSLVRSQTKIYTVLELEFWLVPTDASTTPTILKPVSSEIHSKLNNSYNQIDVLHPSSLCQFESYRSSLE